MTLRRNGCLSDLVPFTVLITFIVLVLVSAEIADKNRKRRVGNRPSSALERREKQYPYMMPEGTRVKAGMSYSGNPDYTMPVPQSQQDDNEQKGSEFRTHRS